MYKVMIVDDEILVRIGLKSTLDWESLGFTVVAEAANGEQAFEQYKMHSPEIVITDIKMPKKDGLWLTKAIRKNDSLTKILILTCYDDFGYAREALKSGADDYVLKSEVEDEELINALLELKKSLDREQSGMHKDNVQPQNVLEQQADFIDSVISGRLEGAAEFKSKFDRIELSEGVNQYAFVCVVRNDLGKKKASGEKEWRNMNNAITNLTINALTERGISRLYCLKDDAILFLLYKTELDSKSVEETIEGIKTTVKQYFNTQVNVACSTVFEKLEQGQNAYQQLENGIDSFFYGDESGLNRSQEQTDRADLYSAEKNLKQALMNFMDEEDSKNASACIMDAAVFLKQSKVKPFDAKLFYANIVNAVFERYNHCFVTNNGGENYSYYYSKIIASQKLDEILELLNALLPNVISLISEYRKKNSRYIIDKIMDYIEKNYARRIYLDELAEHINVSRNYVCYLFKKETGTNITMYANKLRIEKSKQMLLLSQYTVRDVCDKLGFSDQQYFSKTFKKMTGLTVTQYRNKINGQKASM